jgi:DHA2 family methylenomycin A resistance protein-like MFS transporter
LTLVCAGIFIVYLDATVVNVALPVIQRDLGMGVTGAQWVVNVYVLVFACLLLTAGTLADVVGRKSVFLTGLVGFTFASIVCAVAPSSLVLLIGRGLQGACASLVIPVSLAIISDLYEVGHARARAMGIWSGLGGLALAIGPAVGGLLVEGLNWQSIFWVNVPVGVLAAMGLLRLLPETRSRARGGIDYVGQALLVGGTSALTYALIEGNVIGWHSDIIWGLFGGAAVALALFIFWESRGDNPMLPLHVFRNAVLSVGCVVNFFMFMALFAVVFTFTFFLQDVGRLSPWGTGLRILALTIPIMVGSVAASVMSTRVEPKFLIAAGSMMAAIGLWALSRLQVGAGFGSYGWSLALLGFGAAFAGAPASVAILASVPSTLAGTASGTWNTFRQLGAVLGVATAGMFVLGAMQSSLAVKLSSLPLVGSQSTELTAAFQRGDWSVIRGLPGDVQSLVLSQIGPMFVAGMQTTLLLTSVCNFVCAFVALLLMPRTLAT